MEVIAERHLELRTHSGVVEVVVKLGRPARDATYDSWKCDYEVRFGDDVTTMAMHSGDAIQALQLSMAPLDMELERGARKYAGALYHLDEPFTSILEGSSMRHLSQKESP